MAYPTAVNDQVTDAITQVNSKVLGEAPAVSLGKLFQSAGQALAYTAYNGTSAQQNANVTGQAATTVGVAMIYSIDVGSIAKSK